MRNDDGFTLLEVLVAFVIAAAALGLLFNAAGDGIAAVDRAGRTEEAVSRAKSHLAALGRDVALADGTFEGDDGGGYRWRIRVTPVATSTPPDMAPSGGVRQRSLSLYAIEITLSWTDGGQDREVVLRSERLLPARH
ncbi:type II secretion system protein [Telmatospirillum siberiense]|uniref:Pseudopilin I n=1 Tax=Telmatospirillum siberiense TaxID=382514 RepID=A0A2N3PQE2_9PROT|nr:prepilin-type N-terminal cleavage/methylation domain-containing protein [Telmatospirillum siberiense]PKU22602.1 pseudopilin I [Telmatospirillum siberiense]